VPGPLATRSIIVGLDSYSDLTVAHRDIAYNIHRIAETVQTGAGEATYQEEGLVDIVDGLYSFCTVPALIAQTPNHLPPIICPLPLTCYWESSSSTIWM
jgi:hypothetical protein